MKTQLYNLVLVITKDGYAEVKPWNKCTPKEQENAVQWDEFLDHVSSEFPEIREDMAKRISSNTCPF
jgi:hypothetical protein